MDVVDNIVNQFDIQELLKIAEQIDISPISVWGPRKLVDVMNSRLSKGMPNINKMNSDIQPLFMDYLYVANFIDEDDQLVEMEVSDVETLQNVMKNIGITNVPDCFSYADDKDAACVKCPIFKHCAEYRISNLPACYGHLYENGHRKCMKCMEAAFCKLSGKSDREAEITINFT